jgi:hypothetical protein
MLCDQVVCVDIAPRSLLEPKAEQLWQAGFPCEIRQPVPGFVGLYISASDERRYCVVRPLD